MARIAVIGAGAWGTALSIALGRGGSHQLKLWAYEKEVVESIRTTHVNEPFLSGCRLPESIEATQSLAEAISGAEIVLSVMPSHHVRRVWKQMKPLLRPDMLLVSATKGIENESLLRMTEVITEVLTEGEGGFQPRLCAVSGPTFAREVAMGFPTTITVASAHPDLTAQVQEAFSDANFRLYRNDDVIGLELGGAVKNVIAIAAGVVDGIGYGHNTIAGLITRGLAEMTRLTVACGGRSETMSGLSGLGDLVLTCTGGLSRNRSVGVELGRGRKLEEIIAGMHGMVAEGVLTTSATVGLASSVGVEMPIIGQMHEILQHGKDPSDAIRDLMNRPLTQESALYRV
ncbi:MAG TPA: NAD(P)H-dependent glycerol-3-phosphate dehydrogenase [Candidatus Saccharimonadales bacterium]|nr:NAD(P)H-dependent glycerol-3-phosphate dehydrogenase [Candidatus Saccharimonadales bacterium]